MNTSTLCELQCSDFEECGTGTSGFWGRTLPLCVNISAQIFGNVEPHCVNFSAQTFGDVGQEPPISEEVLFFSV